MLQAQTQSVTEDGAVLHGQLSAMDVDSGDHLTYSSNGPVAGFVLNADGSYTFDASHADYQHLAAGEHQDVTIPVTVTDSAGATSTQNLTITVTGTNDAPVVTGGPGLGRGIGARGVTTEDATPGSSFEVSQGGTRLTLSDHGILAATDADTPSGELHWQIVGDAQGHFGGLSLNPTTGEWRYTLDNSNPSVQALSQGVRPLTEVFTVAVTDGHGGRVETKVVVQINGRNDDPVITLQAGDSDHGALNEDDKQAIISGTLSGLDVDSNAHSQGSVAGTQGSVAGTSGSGHETGFGFTQHATDAPLAWSVGAATADLPQPGVRSLDPHDLPTSQSGIYGTLSIDENTGQWTYTLDNTRPETQALAAGQTVHESFEVRLTDPNFATTTHTVTIDVTGTNDAPVVSGVVALADSAADAPVKISTSELLSHVTAIDCGDVGHLSITGLTANHGTFALMPDGKTPVLDADGNYLFTPDPHYHGAVEFKYSVRDPEGSDVATKATMELTEGTSPTGVGRVYVSSGSTAIAADSAHTGTIGNADHSNGEALQPAPVVTGQLQHVVNRDSVAAAHVDYSAHAPQLKEVLDNPLNAVDHSPVISTHQFTVQKTETGLKGVLAATDPDVGESHQWSVQASESGTGGTSVRGQYGTLSIDPDTGHWNFVFSANDSGVVKSGSMPSAEQGHKVEEFYVTNTDAAGHGQTMRLEVELKVDTQHVHGNSGHWVAHLEPVGAHLAPPPPPESEPAHSTHSLFADYLQFSDQSAPTADHQGQASPEIADYMHAAGLTDDSTLHTHVEMRPLEVLLPDADHLAKEPTGHDHDSDHASAGLDAPDTHTDPLHPHHD